MKNILLGMKLCELSYKDRADCLVGLHDDLGLNYFQWIDNPVTDVQGFVCANEDEVFVTIRGTEFTNWEDWKTNLDCAFTPGPYGNCHRGFRLDAVSIAQDVLDALTKHRIKKRKLYILGHSQGAGVSKQLAIHLLGLNVEVHRAIGYGEPRNVDAYCAENLDNHFPGVFHRVVNNSDLVTRVPLRIMRYKHFGQLHYFMENGVYTTEISAWERFLDRMAGRVKDIGQ